ncbi:MAG: hypothetical protein WEE64_08690 [Dehalococcoidia bacterium]
MTSKTTARVLQTACALAVACAMACNGALGTDKTPEPPASALESESFLTPVAEAREAGIEPYWLGEEFEAGGLRFIVHPTADLTDAADSRYPGLSLDYFARTAKGSARTGVEMYSKAGKGPQIMLDRTRAVAGVSVEELQLAGWPANLVTVPLPPRPVNKLWLFVDAGDTVVIVQANSGATGVPGTDPNPLIDKDLLIQVVAENLQPIPE